MKTLSVIGIFIGPAAVATIVFGSLATAVAMPLRTGSLPVQQERASAGVIMAMGMGGGMGGGMMGSGQTGPMGGGQMGPMGGNGQMSPMGNGMGNGQMSRMGNGMSNGQMGPTGSTSTSGTTGNPNANRHNRRWYGPRRNGAGAAGRP